MKRNSSFSSLGLPGSRVTYLDVATLVQNVMRSKVEPMREVVYWVRRISTTNTCFT
jgi:hypothetical protein